MSQTSTEADWFRDRILTAAETCLAHYGSAKTSMVDVARVAGVSRATLYKYFTSKQGVIDAVIDREERVFFAGVVDEMDRYRSFEDQIAAAALYIQKYQEDRREMQRALLTPGDEARVLASRLADYMGDFITVLEPYVEAAQARGDVLPHLNVNRTAEWCARLIFSFMQPFGAVSAADPLDLFQFFKEHLMSGLGPVPSARRRRSSS